MTPETRVKAEALNKKVLAEVTDRNAKDFRSKSQRKRIAIQKGETEPTAPPKD
jgi:hypothetical protein